MTHFRISELFYYSCNFNISWSWFLFHKLMNYIRLLTLYLYNWDFLVHDPTQLTCKIIISSAFNKIELNWRFNWIPTFGFVTCGLPAVFWMSTCPLTSWKHRLSSGLCPFPSFFFFLFYIRTDIGPLLSSFQMTVLQSLHKGHQADYGCAPSLNLSDLLI